jgi:hypothetical protein
VGLHFTWPGLGIVTKALQLLGQAPLAGGPMGGAERLFDTLCFGLWLLGLGLLLAVALRPGLNRWLRFTAALYLLPALCTSTQIWARFPDYTRVWIDVASLALLGLLSLRNRLVFLGWLMLSSIISFGYAVGFFAEH